MIELATCSWRKFRPEMGVPVRITLGKPPAWFSHEHEEIRALAPPGHVFRIEDWQEFRRKYRHHLYRVTVPRIRRKFEAISEQHDGRCLVLLCFEADRADCHRGLWSEWWRQQTGEEVPELGGSGGPAKRPDAQHALFDGDGRERG